MATDQVAAQPDGVHFQVRSVSKGRAFQIADVGGDNAPAPEGVLTWALPPGEIRIWCGPTDPTDSDWVAVRVVDPLDVYVPAQLTCASSAHGSVDYAAGARGERGDPVAITKRHLRLGPGDTVEPAGYPATADREVRVMHDGSIVMLATFTPDDHGGWLLSSTDTCAKSDIHWGS